MGNKKINRLFKKISKKSKKRWSLNEWVIGLYHIYQDVDYMMDPADIWLQVVNDASQLVEEIRKGRFDRPDEDRPDALRQLVKMFCWICGFVGKYTLEDRFPKDDPIQKLLQESYYKEYLDGEESYEKWILLKYPSVCFICGNEHCLCSSYRAIVENRDQEIDHNGLTYRTLKSGWTIKKLEAQQHMKKQQSDIVNIWSLDKWVHMFNRIYSLSQFGTTIESIAFHLLEEVGEVSNEILYLRQLHKMKNMEERNTVILKAAKKINIPKETIQQLLKTGSDPYEVIIKSNIRSLKEEIADVFSWIAALLHKIYSHTEMTIPPLNNITFADKLIKHFRTRQREFGCSFCGYPQCSYECVFTNTCTKIIRKALKDRT